ncbi:MAG: insulinase family protein [Alphaproteobacteria bacterium]|nr:insulinase family protein [Alphaproteobacteria bacterium]
MRPILLCLALLACKKGTPPEKAVTTDAEEPLPVDVAIRTGRLDNGLTYFIEKNARPANRAVLRLAVDAGSNLEEDDQLGVAHFLEHMAFNGTESFPSNDLIAYLESVGTEFGPHLNAHTSFDETVYKLSVPTDDPAVFDKGFTVLKEWACCLALDPAEIEKERGVVLEEWRLQQGLQQRLTDIRVPLVYAESRFAERLPIGTPESLKGFDPAVVGAFYRDWYRPELMAVIVAGDVDVDATEALIKERFSTLASPEEPRERVRFDIPAQEGPLYAVHADAELGASFASLVAKGDHAQAKTWADWREHEHAALATAILNERLSELSRDPESPFLGAGVGNGQLTPTEGIQSANVTAKEGRELEAIEKVLLEVKRFRVHGVTAPELARAQSVRIEFMDKYEREAQDTNSVEHADEIVRHFLQDEPMPGTVVEAELTRKATRMATLADVNAWAARFLDGDRVTMLFMPAKDGLAVPDEAALRGVEERVAAAPVEAPALQDTIESLVAAPDPGTIAERDDTYAERMGFRGFHLANGTRVYYRPSDLKAGEVLFTAWREGGIDAIDDAEFVTAWAAPRIRSQSGLGEHDPNAIARYLKGKTAGVSASIGDENVFLSGGTSTRDLPVALELAYLHLTQPRFAEDGMRLALEAWRESLVNARNNPDQQFSDTWRALFWPDDPRRKVLEPAQLDGVDLARAEAIWDAAMGAPSEWTFVFVGDLPDDFEDQVARWLGAVPSRETGLGLVDRGFHRKPGQFREVLEIGSGDRARYRTEMWTTLAPERWNRELRVHLNAWADIVQVKLRERLREDLGGVYGVGFSASSWDWPYHGVRVRVDFSCDPARVEELETAMMEVLEDLRKNGIDPKYVDAEKAKNREWFEDAQQTNNKWLGDLSSSLRNDEDPHENLDFLKYNDALSADLVKAFANDFLKDANRGTVVLLPKPGEGGTE